jgi:hypothetical protein
MMEQPPNVPGGVPILGNGVKAGPSGLVVQMQQPDGNVVVVPLELASFHVLVECREFLGRIADALAGPAEVVAEAEGLTGGNDATE